MEDASAKLAFALALGFFPEALGIGVSVAKASALGAETAPASVRSWRSLEPAKGESGVWGLEFGVTFL